MHCSFAAVCSVVHWALLASYIPDMYVPLLGFLCCLIGAIPTGGPVPDFVIVSGAADELLCWQCLSVLTAFASLWLEASSFRTMLPMEDLLLLVVF